MTEERTDRIITEVRSLHAKVDAVGTKVDCVDRKIEGVQRDLIGTMDKRGLVRRVEDLEQTEAKRSRVVWIAIGASVAAVVKSWWGSVFGE